METMNFQMIQCNRSNKRKRNEDMKPSDQLLNVYEVEKGLYSQKQPKA